MLTEAHIEIVDDRAQLREYIRILGQGEIALVETKLDLPGDDVHDALIALRNGVITVDVSSPGSLCVDGAVIAGRMTVDKGVFIATLAAAAQWRISVRRVVQRDATLLSGGGAVIRSHPIAVVLSTQPHAD